MKKVLIFALSILLIISLVACGNSAPKGKATTAVTWDELIAANELETVFEKTGGYSVTVTSKDDGEEYFFKSSIVDGKLVYTTGSEGGTSDDLYDGIIYTAYEKDGEKRMEIVAPDTTYCIPDDYNLGTYFAEFSDVDTVYENDDAYFVKLNRKDEDWGYTVEGYMFFDKESLLLNSFEMTQKLSTLKTEYVYDVTYGATEFAMPSYENVTDSENAIELTIHYPDGAVKTTKVDRDTEVIMGYSENTEWSVCWDEACTGSVDNFRWVEGDKADLYVCEGNVPKAPPLLEVVLSNSTFEAIYNDNYDSYYQNIEILDKDENALKMVTINWFVDEETGKPSLVFEVMNEEYETVTSAIARENAWYSWTLDGGYAVDFFNEFSYVEGLVDEERFYINEEHMAAGIAYNEETGYYYVPYVETLDGGVDEYVYSIHPDSDFFDRVEITHKDAAGTITGYTQCYIGGNGYPYGNVDVFAEISEPSDADVIKLTVVTANGEKTYSIRKDASISYEGEALYSDEACTIAVSDLSWVDGKTATVYVK